ncbi:MAG: DNA repair protein RadA [Cytophagales bacterium]
MSKMKTGYFCQSCGHSSPKWLGKCPACNEWNSFVEEVIVKDSKDARQVSYKKEVVKPKPIHLVDYENKSRFSTNDVELDRVLGGGIVPGSLVLVGGEPGIGKSTLMLQVALSQKDKKVLYVSGEESDQQVKMRAERMDIGLNKNCFLFPETNTQNIFKQAELLSPDMIVIDSIQTLQSAFIESAPGSVSQVRECTAELLRFAKETGVPVFLIGHITKEGSIAGPKVLEHMVDTVLQFEGDRHLVYRLLRTIKNRFGSTSELGIYEMNSNGLRQVNNPSEILISQREHLTPGVAIAATVEGNRPLLVEIQSLVSPATYGNPQRVSNGYDPKRLNMLLAVLEKRVGFKLGSQDVFLNVAGGIKIEDPAVDLAVCVSIISSFEEIPISDKCCFAAEVGLGGEIRAVNRIESRISEAEKLGMNEIYISKFVKSNEVNRKQKIIVNEQSQIKQVIESLFG